MALPISQRRRFFDEEGKDRRISWKCNMINGVNGVEWVEFEVHGDTRGSLIAVETGGNISFPIKRIYYIYDTLPEIVRGKHAHRDMNQVLLCVHGECDIAFFDGERETVVHLDTPRKGVLITGYVWREMSHFSEGCVLLALTDKRYQETEYIYDKKLMEK